MRYFPIDDVSFTTINGDSFTIKDMREYPAYTKLIAIDINVDDRIDEVASRMDIYGDNAESESYKIVDFNIVKLYESKFTLSEIKTLDIPNNR